MSEKIRLAIVTSHPIQYQTPWFRKLAAHPGVDLTVLFTSDHGVKPSYDVGFQVEFSWDRPLTEGFRHLFVPSAHPRPNANDFWGRTNPRLWTLLRRESFDAVLVYGWAYASAWVAFAAARAHGLKLLLHGESNLGPATRPRWKQAVRMMVLRSLFERVDGFLAIGTFNRELYAALGVPSDRVFHTPYSVDNDFFTAELERRRPLRGAMRASLGVHDDRPIILCCGKLIPRKAPLDLLHAFSRVRDRVRAKLVFLGDGELRGDIERAARSAGAEDDVLVTGFKNMSEIGDCYIAADVLVHPATYETWGLVVNEAMLFGLPVICSDAVSAHRDLVVARETGDTYPVGDVASLALRLEKYLADPRQLRKMGLNAQERMRTWSYDVCVEGTWRALLHVMA